MNKTSLSLAGLVVALVLFFAINVLGATMLKSARMDFTEDKLYTLSDGTKNILRNLDQDISLYFFFSKKVADEADPQISEFAQRIEELLEEYVAHSGGKLSLEVIDPEQYSEEEDRANAFGLRGAPVQAGKVFLGLAATNEIDDEETIPFILPNREQFLEYDLTKMISTLDSVTQPKVALMSTLEMRGSFNPQTQRPPQPWFIVEQIEGTFDLTHLPPTATEIPEDVTILVLVHPKKLSAATKFAIDQFVLRGGNLLCFVDPFCERDMPPPDPQNPMAAIEADASSDLDELFAAWGVELIDGKVILDNGSAAEIRRQEGPMPVLVYLQLEKDRFETEDPIAADLDNILLLTAGALKQTEGATTTLSPLITSTQDSTTMDKVSIALGLDPESLIERFVADGDEYVLAARVSGSVKTAYPEGPVEEGAEPGEVDETWLSESNGDINVIVVADADMLIDGAWVRIQDFLGRRIANPTADNGNFVMNALDNLSGSNDLISLRSRGRSRRPFDRVAEIRKDADQKLREKEKGLEQELSAAQARLDELQSERTDGQTQILTQAQRDEIQKFRAEETRVRKELRDVKHEKNKKIDDLGTTLFAANALFIPSLIAIFGLVSLASGRKKRRN